MASLLFALAFGALPISSALGQAVQSKNFKVASFYEAPHQQQMKFLLEGAKAEQQGKGAVFFTQPKWQTFKQTGEREFLMEAPECIYSAAKRTISSPSKMQLRAADGKFLLEGEGFLWQQINSSLTLSNHVHTVLHSDLFRGTTNQNLAPAQPERRIEVFADQFDYDTGSGLGVYRGHVRAVGTNLVLSAAVLNFELPIKERQLQQINASNQVVLDYNQIRATGEQATYVSDKDLVHLSGAPTWAMGTQQGRADDLWLDRTNQLLQAIGHAYLKMPGRSLQGSLLGSTQPAGTNAAPTTNQWVEIRCANYEFRTNTALFRQEVRVLERTGDQVRGRMSCGTMNVTLGDTNQVRRLLAVDQVVIEQDDRRFESGQALYDATNGVLDLTQNPVWFAGQRTGRGQTISLVHGEEMVVNGQASMRLPAAELAQPASGVPAGMTKTGSTNEAFAQIFAESYTLRHDSCRFQHKVRIEHPQMDWQSETLTVHFGSSGGVDRIEAETGVAFTLTGEREQRMHGTGQKAVYTYSVTPTATNDLVELTGNPVLVTSNGVFRNSVIFLDRAHNKLLAPGNYRIQSTEPMGTNKLFAPPKLKFLK